MSPVVETVLFKPPAAADLFSGVLHCLCFIILISFLMSPWVPFTIESWGINNQHKCKFGGWVVLLVWLISLTFPSPKAISILLLPHNIPASLNLLTNMVDDMWHYAGDQSTDVSLGGVMVVFRTQGKQQGNVGAALLSLYDKALHIHAWLNKSQDSKEYGIFGVSLHYIKLIKMHQLVGKGPFVSGSWGIHIFLSSVSFPYLCRERHKRIVLINSLWNEFSIALLVNQGSYMWTYYWMHRQERELGWREILQTGGMQGNPSFKNYLLTMNSPKSATDRVKPVHVARMLSA